MNKKLIFIFLSMVLFYKGVPMVEAAAVHEDNPFGVLEFLSWNHAWNKFQYPDEATLLKALALMKEAGVAFVRMDFSWQDIEPQQGQFDYNKYDTLVDLVYANGIQILGILDYSADWASPKGKWNYPSPDNANFIAYAQGVVNRYKDKIKYWELWNEPDSGTYWNPQDGMQSYVTMLKEVYTALKKTDPSCHVLNGGISAGLASVNHLYDNGAKGYFDIMNIHIFETPLDPHAIKRAVAYVTLTHKIMARNGDADKKIWVTEIGCPGVKHGLSVKNWWMGKNPSEKDQARWVKEIYTELPKDEHVGKVFWAFFRDTNEHWANGVDYFGLIRHDFSKKPSFEAYRKIAR